MRKERLALFQQSGKQAVLERVVFTPRYEIEDLWVDERIVKDDVGGLQKAQGFYGEKLGITRASDDGSKAAAPTFTPRSGIS
jgi:hypothetical protein